MFAIFIVPPIRLKLVAVELALYFPAILRTPPSTVRVPPVGARSSFAALPIVSVPRETLIKPERLIPALVLTTAVEEFTQSPELALIVVSPVNGTTVAAVGVESLKTPFVSVKKFAGAANGEQEISRILFTEDPILIYIRLNWFNIPVPLTVWLPFLLNTTLQRLLASCTNLKVPLLIKLPPKVMECVAFELALILMVPLALIVMLLLTLNVKAVFPEKRIAAPVPPVPTVNELQKPFTSKVIVFPLEIVTLLVLVGTPAGVQIAALLQLPLPFDTLF